MLLWFEMTLVVGVAVWCFGQRWRRKTRYLAVILVLIIGSIPPLVVALIGDKPPSDARTIRP